MKKLTVVIAESGKFNDIELLPGTTAQDVLKTIGLSEGYVLSGGKGQEPFGNDEVIYDAVSDGGKIYASTPVEVGFGPLPISQKFSGLNKVISFIANLPSAFSKNVNDIGNSISQSRPKVSNKSCRAKRTVSISQPKKTTVTSGALLVKRAECPYWKQRGWKKKFGRYSGYFRTKYGSFRGIADMSPSGRVEMFIKDPPECLRNHSHWPCFMLQKNGWYFIHNNRAGDFDLSSGLLDVENILTEAHQL